MIRLFDHLSSQLPDVFMSTELEQSITRTLCWFSVFDRPITSFEIWKWLIEPARSYDLSEVSRVLATSEWLKGKIEQKDGFYLLQPNDMGGVPRPRALTIDHIQARSKNYLDSVKKFRKLRRATLYFRLLGSVRSVAAVNSIAWWNTNEQSDIDLYVITKPGSIWSARFWMVLPFILFGVRPGASDQDPFCFSFFSTSSALAMDSLRLKEGDHYFAFWLKSMVPLFDRDQQFGEMYKQNAWANQVLSNASCRHVHPLHRSRQLPALVPHTGFFESMYRSISQKRFPRAIQQLANKDSRVVISDDMLKFHETDRRAEFERVYQERVKNTMV